MEKLDIKTMKLYHHLNRIERRLQELGYTDPDEQVDPERLGTMDSLHFFGNEPIEKILTYLREGQEEEEEGNTAPTPPLLKKQVLDIGTGYGGTARLLASRSGCRVVALELQPDMSKAAKELTRRCGLEDRVTHLTGDFLSYPIEIDEYDVVVGLLCFMHIDNWQELFQRCFDALKPGGVIYVEDFFQLKGKTLTDEDKQTLKHDIYCSMVHDQSKIIAILENCGFHAIDFQDVTPKWKPFLKQRAQTYHANLAGHIERDGLKVAQELDHFYSSVARIFQAGNVGGFTLVARKPAAVICNVKPSDHLNNSPILFPWHQKEH